MKISSFQGRFRHIQADTTLQKIYADSMSENGKLLSLLFGFVYIPPDKMYDGFTDIFGDVTMEADDFLQ